MSWITFDWEAFGRTRGGFVDVYGQVTAKPRSQDIREPEDLKSFVQVHPDDLARKSPYDLFRGIGPARGWDSWIEWRPLVRYSVRDLMPVIRVERGGIKFFESPHV